jgi:hypothetical protein
MILTKRKSTAHKHIKDGRYKVSIYSIGECLHDKQKCLKITFKCADGAKDLILPINDKLLPLLNKLTYISGLSQPKLADFVGINLTITITNNLIKYIEK